MGASALGVKVETLNRSYNSWNGDLLPKRNDFQAEVNVPRHFNPVINTGVLLKGKLRDESDDGASQTLQPGQVLIEMVKKCTGASDCVQSQRWSWLLTLHRSVGAAASNVSSS